ncbi:MAG: hypothetical protein IMF26_08800 [Candidatus Fermentithermobacillus carboniphilus]|uniref:Ferritin-like domain-containing protein n=1 Tax=Candidatus Fermentithermobacillus carboniphilus TaxID=3085328 RepID=A0AAT9LBI7_9FIRM|nr:MAG: hypothetical protein IMF26_08800 [Candidatus Fermentithermobacillus carboniphilus]
MDEVKDMMDDWIGTHMDPHMIIDHLIRSEEREIQLYTELARMAPSEPLRRTIEAMIDEQQHDVEALRALHDMFPTRSSPIMMTDMDSPGYGQRTWLDMVRTVRHMEMHHVSMLMNLAALSSDPHVQRIILQMADEELQEAVFWNTIVLALGWMHLTPVPPGPGWMPGRFSEEDKK